MTFSLWSHLGLNQGPPDYESGATNQLSYRTPRRNVFSQRLPTAVGRSLFLLLTQTYEVWVSLRLSREISKNLCLKHQIRCKGTAFFSNNQINLIFCGDYYQILELLYTRLITSL